MSQDPKPLCQELAEALKLDFVKLGLKHDVSRVDTFSDEAARIAAEFVEASLILSKPLLHRTIQAVKNL